MKERRVALLGQKCWGGPSSDAEETQAFEATQTFEKIRETVKELSEARQTEKHYKAELDEFELMVQNARADAPPSQVVEIDPLEPQSNHKGDTNHGEDLHDTVAEPLDEEKNATYYLPVLPGCLDKNFKCPVSILQQDVDTLVSMGYTTEAAAEALVKSRGELDGAVEALLRSPNQRDENVEVSSPVVKSPTSPSAADLVNGVEAISRAEQQELKDEMKGNENDNEEDEEEEANHRETKKRPKAKAKGNAKTSKPKAKAKSKAKAQKGSGNKGAKTQAVKETQKESTRKRKGKEAEVKPDVAETKVRRRKVPDKAQNEPLPPRKKRA